MVGLLSGAGAAQRRPRSKWASYHKAKRTARRQVYPWVVAGLVVFVLATQAVQYFQTDAELPGRKLLAGSSCEDLGIDKWVKRGGVVFHFIGVIYLFLGIAIICDDYFVNSLESISEALNLSEDVAGATFMAAGSSAPELFSSLMSLTNPNADDGIGIGTIVGSAVFNILVIIGVTAICAGRILILDWRPMLRDGTFYCAAIISVILAFLDNKIHWWEGIAFSLCYVVYILFMKGNARFMGIMDGWFPNAAETRERQRREQLAEEEAAMRQPTNNGSMNKVVPTTDPPLEDAAPVMPSSSDQAYGASEPLYGTGVAEGYEENGVNGELKMQQQDLEMAGMIKAVPVGGDKANGTTQAIAETAGSGAAELEEEDDDGPFWMPPKTGKEMPMWLLSLPWNCAFCITVPNCKDERWEKWYFITFVGSILWIGVISWFMVEWAAVIGCVLHIPAAIMGVTVLAAGTSIPDALSSIVVARQGMGDMAVANAVGSNVFDIWLGLGLPWVFVLGIRDIMDKDGAILDYDESGTLMLTNVFILFGVLAAYMGTVMFLGWKLTPRVGWMFLVCYILYVIYYVTFVWNLDIFDQDD